MVEGGLEGLKRTRFEGRASFATPTVRVRKAEGRETLLRGERILMATGSSPLRPPEFAFGDDGVHDSDEIHELKAMPTKLVVIGAA